MPAGQGRRAHGQKHHDEKGHPWPPGEQPVSGEVRVSLGTMMTPCRQTEAFQVFIVCYQYKTALQLKHGIILLQNYDFYFPFDNRLR